MILKGLVVEMVANSWGVVGLIEGGEGKMGCQFHLCGFPPCCSQGP